MQISVRNLSTRKLTSRMEFSALDVGVSTTLPMDLSLCSTRRVPITYSGISIDI